MSKSLLTQRGRMKYSMAILACCLVLMLWASIPYLRVPPPGWVQDLANWAAVLSLMALIGLGWYVGHVRFSIIDLVEETERRLDQGSKIFYAQQDMKTEFVKVSEMSRKSKLGTLGFVLTALVFFGFGIADFTGLAPQWIMTATDGERISVSRWLTGSFAILMGFIAILASIMLRFKTVSRADEALKELISEGKIVLFPYD